jgi:hypothetical protein
LHVLSGRVDIRCEKKSIIIISKAKKYWRLYFQIITGRT